MCHATELGLPDSLPRAILEIYVFGSYARGSRTSDVDLLVVWDTDEATPLEAQELRRVLRARLTVTQPLDVILLTAKEAVDAAFVENEGAELVYQRADAGSRS